MRFVTLAAGIALGLFAQIGLLAQTMDQQERVQGHQVEAAVQCVRDAKCGVEEWFPRRGDEPIATAMAYESDGVASLQWVGTVPAAMSV